MIKKNLTLGFSPCPNDTFIFDALVNRKIDTEDLVFDYMLADVEELNRRAFNSELDITKISTHAYAYVAQSYAILDSGSALGFGNGPLVIGKKIYDQNEVNDLKIGIPGKYTTANLLFSIAWPRAVNKTEYLFTNIEDAILENEVDAGLIIHETRFTYQKRGLLRIADLGEYWEQMTGLPIPLGNIVISRKISHEIALKVNRLLKKSIEYALSDPLSSDGFVSLHAREMDKEVMNKHIRLYVNDFTVNLGSEGHAAIKELFRFAANRKIIPPLPGDLFISG
jgi:1,4-dihydroxy-6-naphthoate synthase